MTYIFMVFNTSLGTSGLSQPPYSPDSREWEDWDKGGDFRIWQGNIGGFENRR
jgi:hypothetical protein